ncbi:MAG: hypothetical protein ACLSH6_10665 [Limosilactobacillus pontis]
MGQKAVELVNNGRLPANCCSGSHLATDQMAQYHLASSVKVYHQLSEIEEGIADI